MNIKEKTNCPHKSKPNVLWIVCVLEENEIDNNMSHAMKKEIIYHFYLHFH